jgi:hypothetical protein
LLEKLLIEWTGAEIEGMGRNSKAETHFSSFRQAGKV